MGRGTIIVKIFYKRNLRWQREIPNKVILGICGYKRSFRTDYKLDLYIWKLFIHLTGMC